MFINAVESTPLLFKNPSKENIIIDKCFSSEIRISRDLTAPVSISCKNYPFLFLFFEKLCGPSSSSTIKYIQINVLSVFGKSRSVYVEVAELARKFFVPEEFLRLKTCYHSHSIEFIEDVQEEYSAIDRLLVDEKKQDSLRTQIIAFFKKAVSEKDTLNLSSSAFFKADKRFEGVISKDLVGRVSVFTSLACFGVEFESVLYKVYDVTNKVSSLWAIPKNYLLDSLDLQNFTKEFILAKKIIERRSSGHQLVGLPIFLSADIYEFSFGSDTVQMGIVKKPIITNSYSVLSAKAKDEFDRSHSLRDVLPKFLSIVLAAKQLTNMSFFCLDLTIKNIYCVNRNAWYLDRLDRLVDISNNLTILKQKDSFLFQNALDVDVSFLKEIFEEMKNSHSQPENDSVLLGDFRRASEKICVFQLGIILYQLLMPSSLVLSELMGTLSEETLITAGKKLVKRLKNNQDVALFINSMLGPIKERPTLEEVLDSLQRYDSLLTKEPSTPFSFEIGLFDLDDDVVSPDNRPAAETDVSSSFCAIQQGRESPYKGSFQKISKNSPDKLILLNATVDSLYFKYIQSGIALTKGQTVVLDSWAFLESGHGEVQFSVVVDILGKGAYNEVYKVFNLATGKLTALKRLQDGKIGNEASFVEEILEHQSKNGDVFGLQKFIKVTHEVTDSRTGKTSCVNWITSEVYPSDGFVKLTQRKFQPVSFPVLLREFFCLISGLNNLMKIFGRIHMDLKLENFLCSEDGNMVLGDLGDLLKISSVDDWIFLIQNRKTSFVHTSQYNLQSDLKEIVCIEELIRGFLKGDPTSVLLMANLKHRLHFTQEELASIESLQMSSGSLQMSSSAKQKCLVYMFEQYKLAAEKMAVFQLGFSFFYFLFGYQPYYANNLSGYAVFEKDVFYQALQRRGWAMPEQLARLFSSMIESDQTSRPSVVEVEKVLRDCLFSPQL